jgi:hypothetical protein
MAFYTMKIILKNIFLLFSLFTVSAFAETALNFAKSTQNPLAINPETRYFTLPFVNYLNFGYGANNNTQDILDLKPVMPFRFTSSLDLVFRTIIPLMHQPKQNGYMNGLGDINPTAFLAPAHNNWILWGIGPTLVIPTATNKALGAGKWSLGPELVLIMMPDRWTFAILTNNVWSFAGEANRPAVNQFSFQYYITYNFDHGYYVTTQPNITANWKANPSQVWTVPFGAGIGRAFHVGNQAMNVLLQGYSNCIRPSAGPRWFVQATLEFLFKDNRTD